MSPVGEKPRSVLCPRPLIICQGGEKLQAWQAGDQQKAEGRQQGLLDRDVYLPQPLSVTRLGQAEEEEEDPVPLSDGSSSPHE